ncbi:hypothetical protein [Chitinophaga eiseniae]|uniref:Uncharacterized protein n=1 Tax=Chitinophaga eiseniae TaxID=634771 RepID=A0A847SBM2_9BACT|nr:hypothetical protein [Chitinophaga eiseniae]NLR80600.1 hypothetical protein [Chitinophaga eiseniae]
MELGVTILNLKVVGYKANKPKDIAYGGLYNGKVALDAEVSVDVKSRQIAIKITATVFVENDVKDLINLGYIIGETIFHLSDVVWSTSLKKEKKVSMIDSGLESYLIGIAYDSLRGLLHEKGKKDVLGKVILPLVDPSNITRTRKSKVNKNN